MNLKDLKLNDLVKIAITASVAATIALTLNLTIMSNNTTVINNYIQETNKKLDNIQQSNVELIKATNDTQTNITKVKSDINKTLIISEKILREVD